MLLLKCKLSKTTTKPLTNINKGGTEMLQSEFENLTGCTLTPAQYRVFEEKYMNCKLDKYQFAKRVLREVRKVTGFYNDHPFEEEIDRVGLTEYKKSLQYFKNLLRCAVSDYKYSIKNNIPSANPFSEQYFDIVYDDGRYLRIDEFNAAYVTIEYSKIIYIMNGNDYSICDLFYDVILYDWEGGEYPETLAQYRKNNDSIKIVKDYNYLNLLQ